ncbi:class I SAM-dependent methyltransferase [uncultured Methanobrevibacter sp.]|uniref:class I SAM-dependent methyltransferase n=1 Tax=uncultured Methanobrevibacter sp. TaxID=253161 RepID=UPI002601AFA6|nr:methyltransferase domain-containing protein [uncultured Methanobrevibacter sp.]
MHPSSYLKMEYFKNAYLNPDKELKILDIGSFDKSGKYNYGLLMQEEKWTYHGLDLSEGNNVDIVVKDPYNWREIEDESYDVIISGQAFEHIEYFWLTMEQIKRVLKKDGIICIIAPSSGPVHKNPYDCYRFNENGMKSLAKYVDLKVIEAGTNTDISSKPWFDSYLIAKKPVDLSFEHRLDSLEEKLDKILETLDK